jgi:type I restriction enzyme S subunit
MIRHPYRTILGECPKDWDALPLGNLLITEFSESGDWGDDAGEKDYRVIRSTNFTNDGQMNLGDVAVRYYSHRQSQTFGLARHDILIEKSGGSPDQPVGRVLLVEKDMPEFWISNFISRVRPDPEKIHPPFLRWAMHEFHLSGIVERVQNQTTQMRNLEVRDYLQCRIPIPPRDEQQIICELIDSVDVRIAHAKAMLGITGSLHRDNMDGPLNRLKTSLLHFLVLGAVRLAPRSSTAKTS